MVFTRSMLLQDVLLRDDYVKIITDKGNFTNSTDADTVNKIAIQCMKIVGKEIEVYFQSEQDAFDGKFQEVHEKSELKIPTLPLGKRFDNHKSTKIFGPPGTGKTTKLINYVKQAVSNGISPADIAFISFSNGAATVAKQRVVQALPEYGTISFPNFSTMHSLATRVGSETGQKLMVEENFIAFDNTIECWREWTELNNPLGAVERYKHLILDRYNLAIAERGQPNYTFPDNQRLILKAFLLDRFPGDPDRSVETLCSIYIVEFLNYKKQRRLVTFDDVIEKVASSSFPPELIPTFELLIIDEAQDLSNHLWEFAKKLILASSQTFIAGDDDQAIMLGIGANPKLFVDFPATEPDDPLENSYRIPKAVRQYVDLGVMPRLEKLPNRVGVVWKPTDKNGYSDAGYSEIKVDDEGIKKRYNFPFTPNRLILRIRDDYLKSVDPNNEPDKSYYLNEARSLIGKALFENKLYYMDMGLIAETALMSLPDYKNREDVLVALGKGRLEVGDVLRPSFPKINFKQNLSQTGSVCTSGPPDWLVMAPTKKTGEDLSKALGEFYVPHFYRNRPMFGATKENSLIRIQTVHMSKGDEAYSAAIVVQSFGDVAMLVSDPRLAYVALTRSSHISFPRVIDPGLLPDMEKSKGPWAKYAKDYKEMFPIA